MRQALAGATPDALGRLRTAEFGRRMASLHAELDYIHPFSDGNSRTLRVFTSQLAGAAGHRLD